MILNIKPLLKAKGIAAKDLASAVGMSPTNMSYILTGKVFPSEGTLIKIAEELNVPIAQLFIGADCTELECPVCGAKLELSLRAK